MLVKNKQAIELLRKLLVLRTCLLTARVTGCPQLPIYENVIHSWNSGMRLIIL